MSKLKKPITFETTFGLYVVDEIIGEGGAGRVFGGSGPDNAPIALKLLSEDRASRDKRRRFKNEIAFLSRTRHPNIVPVIDHGVSRGQSYDGPFYVMTRFAGSVRDLIESKISADDTLPLFGQILDGVEAAHLNSVIHRDLKPENILHDKTGGKLAIADFGIAQFTEDLVATIVETTPSQRLANFQYAAPEQRVPGRLITIAADIYALGLILNELFTGLVPHGTQYRQVADVDERFAFLDPLIARMLSQTPSQRPGSIAEIKTSIQRYREEAVSLQRISQIDGTVIKSDVIDDPLAEDPPRLIGANWNQGQMTLVLDRSVSREWVDALHNMGRYTSVSNKPPMVFSFSGKQATVSAEEHQAQQIIDYFKSWLPTATNVLKHRLQVQAQQQESERREQLRREREEEERHLRVNQNLRI
jgi:serine/threonine protein kinase